MEEIQKKNGHATPPSKTAITHPSVIAAQNNTDKINDDSEKVNFNREQYLTLYGKFYQLFKKQDHYSGANFEPTLMTYHEPEAAQLKLYYTSGEMVPDRATIQTIGALNYCNGKQVITGRSLVGGKIFFYLEKSLDSGQLFATDLIPPYAVPVRRPNDLNSLYYNDRKVIGLAHASFEKTSDGVRAKERVDYSAHYMFHTQAINAINNTTIVFKSRAYYKLQILFPFETNSLNEEKSNQRSLSTTGIQNTLPKPSNFPMLTAAYNVPRSQVRNNESPTGTFSLPQITRNQMVQNNEMRSEVPRFNDLLSSLGIFSSNNSSSSSLLVDENEKTETNLNF